ncbi:hypothetical protein [Niabella ginsengisoli]|uniref:Uncharacterized protein n=1 Tax=Niabella ginsengisoli TaxID=522298 RepID=A0ABS9SN68_9BACT|nr:hypothetical protein [Niabella ginsengisoli]MCH5599819.1 hypothetical protein [Niabella ginsengisoli]
MYSGIALKDADGKLYLINPIGREKDPQVYNGPNYGVTPTIFESSNNGLSFTQTGTLFTRTAYRGYASPIGNMDAVFGSDGKLIVVGEGGVESPQEGIVIYRK